MNYFKKNNLILIKKNFLNNNFIINYINLTLFRGHGNKSTYIYKNKNR